MLFLRCTDPTSSRSTWDTMTLIKRRIVQLWEIGTIGVKCRAAKFLARVVATQTPGLQDSRISDSSDISLASLPMSHPYALVTSLEPEGQGLLDRLLGSFLDSETNEIIRISVLNCLIQLSVTRKTIAGRIITGLVSFDVEKDTATSRKSCNTVLKNAMKKTIRTGLNYIIRY